MTVEILKEELLPVVYKWANKMTFHEDKDELQNVEAHKKFDLVYNLGLPFDQLWTESVYNTAHLKWMIYMPEPFL